MAEKTPPEVVAAARKVLNDKGRVDAMEDPRYVQYVPQAVRFLHYAKMEGRLKEKYPAYGIGAATKEKPESFRLTHEPCPRAQTMLEVVPLSRYADREVFIFKFEDGKSPVRVYRWDMPSRSWERFDEPEKKENPPVDESKGGP